MYESLGEAPLLIVGGNLLGLIADIASARCRRAGAAGARPGTATVSFQNFKFVFAA